MGKFLIVRSVELSITTVALTVLVTGPALAAVPSLPGPAGGGLLAGGAIIGALVIAKWWRRN